MGILYELANDSTCVCGSADASTLWGGEGSTCSAAEGLIAFATEIGAGNRYAHADVYVDADKVACASANVKA